MMKTSLAGGLLMAMTLGVSSSTVQQSLAIAPGYQFNSKQLSPAEGWSRSSFSPPASNAAISTLLPLSLSLSSASIVGGGELTATITLNAPAPAGGVEITLRSSDTQTARFGGAFAAIGTSQLKIPEGSIRAPFPVRTFGVANRTAVTLQALSGSDVGSATLTVIPASIKFLTIAPSILLGGNSANGTLTLDGLAPGGTGLTVKLSLVREATSRIAGDSPTNSTSAVSIPLSVTVPSGGSSATFSITTVPVGVNTPITVIAGTVREGLSSISDGTSNTISLGESSTSNGGATAKLMVLAPVVSQLVLNPTSVPGGNTSVGSIVLNGKAPSEGLSVALSVQSGGASVEGTAVAQSISSNGVTIPSSVTVTPGADHHDFKITTLPTNTSNSITISAAVANNLRQVGGTVPAMGDGSVRTVGGSILPLSPVTATLLVTPTPPPFTISVQPTQVVGGSQVAITVTMHPTSGSITFSSSITLTSNHPELIVLPATVPASTTSVPTAGAQTIQFNGTTLFSGSDQNVTITAAGLNSTASASLLIKQTPPLASFTLRPTSVTGGNNVIAQFLLVNGATSPVTVNLSTDHPELVTVPTTVTIPVSPVATPFTFRTSAATVATSVTITATAGPQTIPVTLTLVPAAN
jgi:hypothetical protein